MGKLRFCASTSTMGRPGDGFTVNGGYDFVTSNFPPPRGGFVTSASLGKETANVCDAPDGAIK